MATTKAQAIGSRIRQFRKSRGMTQHELGAVLQKREKRVQLLENGKAVLRSDELAVLAKFFGITTDALVNGTQAHRTH